MRRRTVLSMDSLDGFVHDDDLDIEPLARRGWAVESVPWHAEANWAATRPSSSAREARMGVPMPPHV